MSIGPVIGGLLSEISYSLLFYVDAATCFAAGIFLMVVKWDLRKRTGEEQKIDLVEKKTAFFAALSNKAFLYFLLAALPVSIVYMQSMSTLPLYVVEYLRFSNSTFGLLIAVNTVLIILIELPLNASMTGWKDLIYSFTKFYLVNNLTHEPGRSCVFDLPVAFNNLLVELFAEQNFLISFFAGFMPIFRNNFPIIGLLD